MKFNAGTQYENPPAGSHIARCIGLIDMGTQVHKGFQGGEDWTSRDVRIVFELPGEKMTGKFNPEMKGKPFGASIVVKQSLHPSAKLRKLLEGWRGSKFTPEAIERFDPRNLLDKPARLTLIENGDFVNVDSISPLAKGDKCPKRINPLVFFSLDPEEFNQETFDKLSERLRAKIQKSPEWVALGNSSGEDPQPDPPSDEGDPPSDDNQPF